MTYDEINSLQFDPFFAFERLIDKSVLSGAEQAYSWPQGYSGEKNWDNCAVHPLLLAQVGNSKPTDDELLAGSWAEYIAALTAAEDARLAEIERVGTIRNRWALLAGEWDLLASKAGVNKESHQILLDAISSNDMSEIELLESKVAELTAEKSLQKKQAKQLEKISLGNSVVALMGALNESKGLTGPQTGAMVLALATPMALFTSGSTNTAIGAVQAMDLPEGITEQDRTAIVSFAQAGLARIEAKYG